VNEVTIEAVCAEMRGVMIGHRAGKIFALTTRRIAIDLRISEGRYLFIAAESNAPRIYLIKRRLKDLERTSVNPSPFHLLLRKYISGFELCAIEKVQNERVVRLRFEGETETGDRVGSTVIVQLTGKSANVFLLDGCENILGSLGDSDFDGQRIGEKYSLPLKPGPKLKDKAEIALEKEPTSISEELDRFYTDREANERFQSRVKTELKRINGEIGRRRKLIERLNKDRSSHGDARKWKKFGDLILANLAVAERKGDRVVVTDYFEAATPKIEIEADENLSLTQAAEKYFKRYTKAQNAAGEIERRLNTINKEIAKLEATLAQAEKAAQERDESFFEFEATGKPGTKTAKRQKEKFNGAREFLSSDGFTILVGKKASDNDQLTFRIAGSLDLWFHAADYSGSHVVVRNPNRKEIPQRTLLEAAQLAAFYSSGRSQTKAAVNYTQKKFVNKPRGSAPGLVRLASFKTILVEPAIPAALDQKVSR
jgi:predicted ribosome quality control (RQC) complex YloA/Tae2 family protein